MNSSLVTRHSSLPCGAPRRKAAGFTLIELLSVMAVMILITTVVVTSGFGLRRSATYSSVVSIPTSVMEYARQRACMDGRKTAVLFAPNGAEGTDNDEMAARIFQVAGTVSKRDDNGIRDKFSDIAAFKTGFNMLTVFNFTSGKTFVVGEISKESGTESGDKPVSFKDDATSDGEPNMYYYPYIKIIRSKADKSSPSISGNWKEGEAYGFEIADRQILPKNFSYTMKSGGHGGSNDSFWFIFNPDGTTDGSGSAAITVRESVGNKKFKQDISFN